MKMAEQFQDWVYEQVFPSIRRYVEYKLKIEIEALNVIIDYNEKFFENKDDIIEIKNEIIESKNEIIRTGKFIKVP